MGKVLFLSFDFRLVFKDSLSRCKEICSPICPVFSVLYPSFLTVFLNISAGVAPRIKECTDQRLVVGFQLVNL